MTAAACRVEAGSASVVVASSIVLVGSLSSRNTRSVPNAARMVAASVFWSLTEPSGWPTLTTTTPPGASLSRTRRKNSIVVR